jgi:hypothetical protein
MNVRPSFKLLVLGALASATGFAAGVQAQSTTPVTLMQEIPVEVQYNWNNNGTTYAYQATPGGQQASGYQGTSTQNVGSANYTAFDIPAVTTVTDSNSSVSSCNASQDHCTYIAQAVWSATTVTALNGAASLNNIQSTTTLAANAEGSAQPYSLTMSISAAPGGYFALEILPGVYAANTQIPIPVTGVPIETSNGIKLLNGTITLGKITPITDANGNVTGTSVNGLEVDGTLTPLLGGPESTIHWPAGEVTVNLPPSQLAINFQFTSEL